MERLEKVIKGLAACMPQSEDDAAIGCDGCPYNGHPCGGDYQDNDHVNLPVAMIEDIRALLKAQEPRVMKVGDVRNWVNSDRITREPVVIEIRGGVCAWIIDDEVRELPGEENLSSDLYGVTWRCWTSRPTDEQREATPWEQ